LENTQFFKKNISWWTS